jgi:hypothetical protein
MAAFLTNYLITVSEKTRCSKKRCYSRSMPKDLKKCASTTKQTSVMAMQQISVSQKLSR